MSGVSARTKKILNLLKLSPMDNSFKCNTAPDVPHSSSYNLENSPVKDLGDDPSQDGLECCNVPFSPAPDVGDLLYQDTREGQLEDYNNTSSSSGISESLTYTVLQNVNFYNSLDNTLESYNNKNITNSVGLENIEAETTDSEPKNYKSGEVGHLKKRNKEEEEDENVEINNSNKSNDKDSMVLNSQDKSEILVDENSERKSPEENEKAKSRKRKRREEKWMRNIKKRQLNFGEAHTNTRGNWVKGKEMKTTCTENCKFKCILKITNEERKKIFENYCGLGNIDQQRQFLVQSLKKVEPKYRRQRSVSEDIRGNNYQYNFIVNESTIRVCKKYFLNTLSISDQMIKTVLKKINDGGILELDQRGKHPNRKNRISEEIKDTIRHHIESIPTIESHYLRDQTTRKYFEGSLDLATLYRLYVQKCNLEGTTPAHYFQYANIFNYEYNIGFFRPKKDQCTLCARYKNSSNEEKEQIQEQYVNHTRNKELCRAEKRRDVSSVLENKDINTVVAVFDLEAVLPSPCTKESDFYYVSKLSTYNFTIYNVPFKKGYCYVFNETLAKRGANEIASLVMHYLKTYCEGKNVIFYSDNCGGQNKNKFLMTMYLYATQKYNIKTITHKFLILGHTQNEGDSMHSTIEREKERYLKSNKINVPSQWTPIIALAKKSGTPYRVHEVQQNEIFDFKLLASQIGKNYTINTSNEKVNWADIKVVFIDSSKPRRIYYKTDYGEEDFKEIFTNQKQRLKTYVNVEEVKLNCVYNGPLPISKKKKDGLIALCNKNLIDKEHQQFYKDLKVTDQRSEESDEN